MMINRAIQPTFQLSLLITERCNLRCSYCYSKKGLVKSMTLETAISVIDDTLERLGESTRLNLLLMGGEPFLSFDLIKDIVKYIRDYYPHRQIFIKTVTNGTLVHGKVQDWLSENKDIFFASLSVDGKKETHDKNRCKSYDKIDFDFFTRVYGSRAEASMVACPDNLTELAENVMHVENLGFNVKCVLADDCQWDSNRDRAFLIDQLSKLIEHYIGNPDIMPFSMLRESLNRVGKPVLDKCRPWINSICVDTEGASWGCHRCTPLYNQGIWSIPEDKLSLKEGLLMDACKTCPVSSICAVCPALVSSLQNKNNYAKNMCDLFKIVHVANAVFLSRLFIDCPEHVYLKGKSDQERLAIIEGIQTVIAGIAI